MKKIEITILLILSAIAVFIRLFGLNSPIADWHSWRQSDTAAVARNFIKFGFDPLRPRFDDLSNIASGKDNPLGYRMVEFPLYQLVSASLYKLFPHLQIEVWLRIVNIVSSVIAGFLLTMIVSYYTNSLTGILTMFFYTFMPYSVYFSRVVLPETFMLFWSVLSLFMAVQAFRSNNPKYILLCVSAVCFAVALLVKPVAIFLELPVYYLIFRKSGSFKKILILLFLFSLVGFLPFIFWRKWILYFPEGIPVYTWLLNSGNIRFKGAWFYWLFAERLAKLILGYWGLVVFVFGILITHSSRERWIFRWFLIGSLLYLIVFAAGNVQHDYYQILLIPITAIYCAKGVAFLLNGKVFNKPLSFLVSTVLILFMFAFSWYTVRTYYWINRPEIVEAGRLADKLLPLDAKVIASYNGDTTFLYQTNRQGWPIGFDLDHKIEMGATHYVTVSPTDNDLETKFLAEKYTILVRNEKFAIIDMTKLK